MVSSSLRLHTLLGLSITYICLTVIDAKPLDLENIIKSQILSHPLQSYSRYNNKIDALTKDIPQYTSLRTQLLQDSQNNRDKRIGIAGHENMDLILNHLKPMRPRLGGGFQPAMSISASFADLRNMMSMAGR